MSDPLGGGAASGSLFPAFSTDSLSLSQSPFYQGRTDTARHLISTHLSPHFFFRESNGIL
jgi:hypothetical protein